MLLSDLLRIMRKKEFLSQEGFAKALNVSIVTINRWENGKARPNITTMKRIKAFCEDRSVPFAKIEAAWLADRG